MTALIEHKANIRGPRPRTNKFDTLRRLTIPDCPEISNFIPGLSQRTNFPAQARQQLSHSSTHSCLALFQCLFFGFGTTGSLSPLGVPLLVGS